MNLDRTRKLVLAGVWSDAALVMAASAWNGGHVLQDMGDPAGFGTLLGLAVDVGLAVALIGDRTLHLEGKSEPWSRWVRNVTAAMSLGLNCAVPFHLHHWGQMVFHAFLPVLLVLLSEYAQKLTLQFKSIIDEQAARELAEREAARAAERARLDRERRERDDMEMRRANGELVTARDAFNKAVELREQAEREIALAAELRKTADERKPSVTAPRRQTKPSTGSAASIPVARQERKAWVMEERAAGRYHPGAAVDKKFGPPRTGAAIVREVDDELRRATVRAVKG